MGRAPAAARLLSLHALWPGSSAAHGGVYRYGHPARGRVLPAAIAEVDERATVLSGSLDDSGGDLFCAPGIASSVTGPARQTSKLYTGIYMLCSKIFLIVVGAGMVSAAGFSGAAAFE